MAESGGKAQRPIPGGIAQTAETASAGPDAQAFWQFSLALYPPLQQQLLQLQDDYQANVNLVLWLAFQAQQPGPPVSALQQALAPTHQQYTAPLRQLRRRAKEQGQPGLRQALLAAELQAEQLEQQQLVACYQSWLNSQSNPPAAAGTGLRQLRLYLDALTVPVALQQSFLFDLDQKLAQLQPASR